MRRSGKRGAALTLALALCRGGGGGGGGSATTKGFTVHDAEVYVNGLIRENYLGKADESYLELVDTHAEDVEALYKSALSMDVEYFFYMYDID